MFYSTFSNLFEEKIIKEQIEDHKIIKNTYIYDNNKYLISFCENFEDFLKIVNISSIFNHILLLKIEYFSYKNSKFYFINKISKKKLIFLSDIDKLILSIKYKIIILFYLYKLYLFLFEKEYSIIFNKNFIVLDKNYIPLIFSFNEINQDKDIKKSKKSFNKIIKFLFNNNLKILEKKNKLFKNFEKNPYEIFDLEIINKLTEINKFLKYKPKDEFFFNVSLIKPLDTKFILSIFLNNYKFQFNNKNYPLNIASYYLNIFNPFRSIFEATKLAIIYNLSKLLSDLDFLYNINLNEEQKNNTFFLFDYCNYHEAVYFYLIKKIHLGIENDFKIDIHFKNMKENYLYLCKSKLHFDSLVRLGQLVLKFDNNTKILKFISNNLKFDLKQKNFSNYIL